MLNDGVRNLIEKYPADFQNNFSLEYKQFIEFLAQSKRKKKDDESQTMFMFRSLQVFNLNESFPNIETALQIYLSLMITNCTGERSFSDLKRIKNYLRSTMRQERLAALELLSIEYDIVRLLDMEDIINNFATAKIRKMFV